MPLQTEAKKGTVIEVGGVRIEVLRGSPRLEICAPPGVLIKTRSINSQHETTQNSKSPSK